MRAPSPVPRRLGLTLALAAAAQAAHLRSNQLGSLADRCQPTYVTRLDLASGPPNLPFPPAHAAGDFNSDGYGDVIAGFTEFNSFNRHPLRIFTGGPAGFVDGTSAVIAGPIPLLYQPRAMTVADFNGDLRPDVFVAAHGVDFTGLGEPNVLLLSTATGLFDASDRLPGKSDFSHAVASGDIDHDGDVDILVGNFGAMAEEKSSYFLVNDGTGHFARDITRLPARELPGSTLGPPGVVGLVDLSGDGFVELVVGDHGGHPSRVYRNDGFGVYTDASAVTLPEVRVSGDRTLTVDLVASDLDRDGHTDLVFSMVARSNYGGRHLQVLRNLGGGTSFADETSTRMSGAHAESSVSAWYAFIRPFDYNHDGVDDIVVKSVITGGPAPAAGTPFVFLNDGSGHFSPLAATALGSARSYPGPLEPVDAGADGDIDFLDLGYPMAVLEQTGCTAALPGAPAITSITPGQRTLSIAFTPPTPAVAIANYEYSIDNGATWTPRSPGSTSSPLVVQGLTFGTNYSVRLRAVNGAGPGAASSPITGTPSAIPPGAPTIVAVAAASEQLTLTYAPPAADGGADVSNYQFSIDDGSTWTARSPASAISPLAITGLTNGTTYTVRLRAVSAVGAGAPSAAMTATPVSPSLQPPANLRVVSIVGNTVMVAWTAPHGLAATGYVLEGGLSSGEVIASLPVGNTLTFSFTAPTGAYYIRAHALAGSTRSAASNEIRIFVNVPAPPGTPTNLLGLADGTTLTLAWMNSGGGGAATGVILDVSGAIAASLPLPMSEAFTFNGVPPGSYTLSVRATNATGASADSTPVTLTFPGACTAPSTPANFNVSRSGSLITVRWDLPATGSAPTGYLLHVSGTFNGSVPVTTRSLAASAGPGTYTISLAARNSCGTGSATPSQAITVP